MQRVRVARIPREGLDPLEFGDRIVVERELARADLGVAADLVELYERDRREHIGEVRLVSRNGEVVERAVAAPHQPQIENRPRDVVPVRRHEPTLAGGDVLRRIQREAGRVGDRADLPAAIRALERMRRVLDDRHAEREQRIEVAPLPREVHREDRLRPLVDELRNTRRVDVQVLVAHVREDGRRAGVHDHVRGRRPRDRRRDHLVARPNAEREQREMHRRGPGRDRDHLVRLEKRRQPPLQLRRLRPGRQPAGAQRLGDCGDLLVTDRRRLEAERRRAARLTHGD